MQSPPGSSARCWIFLPCISHQPLELLHLRWSSQRFENNKVDRFTYFYIFQYQECAVQIMHVDCEYTGSFQYEPVASRTLIHIDLLFSTCLAYWLEKFLSSCLFMPVVSLYALQDSHWIKVARDPLDSLKLQPFLLMHIFISHMKCQARSVQRCSPCLPSS